jgi:hypothetical protein
MSQFSKTLVFLLLITSKVSGQQFIVRHFNTEEGLPHSTVYRILEDKKGFLWFCTDGGVCSFDGRTFDNKLAVDDSILNCSPISVSEDEWGNKIVCSYNDGICFITDTGTSKYVPKELESPTFYFHAVSAKGLLWIAGRGEGEFLYRVKNGKMKRYELRNNNGEYVQVKKVLQFGEQVLIVSNNGLYRIAQDEVQPYLTHLITGDVKDLRVNRKGEYVAALNDKVVVADNNRIITTYKLDTTYNDMILACDSRDNIWLLAYGQKMLLLKAGKSKDISNMLPMQNLYFNDMMEDGEGNMWIGSYNEGVYMIPSSDILCYQLSDKKANSHCHSIAPIDSESMLVGSIGNVSVFRKGKLQPMPIKNLLHDEFVYFAKAVGHMAYIGTPYKLIRKDMKPPYKEEIMMHQHQGAAAMEIDRQGRIWIGGFGYPYVIEGNKVIRLDNDTIFINKRYDAIIEDKKGNIWLGTAIGLMRYDGQKCEYIICNSQHLI